LVEAGARITVVSPEFLAEFEELPVRLVHRRFRSSDVRGCVLAFAATDDRAVNRRVGIAARREGIFANIADAPGECDFLVPARVRRGSLQIAISTGGENPRVAAALRRKLEKDLEALP
jgi:siroheme synthase-like protein